MIPLQALGLPEILVILVIFVVPLVLLAAAVLGGLYLYRKRTVGPGTEPGQSPDEPDAADETTTP
ncbi:hypothetical protein [Haloarchaeobius baliensis]|uniref:hypothetical protein n=1 Tax=Haloarchaeobius baliensis TaxID=1670458 RepID=UPI003F883D77